MKKQSRTCVNSFVSFQSDFLCKRFATFITCKCKLFVVDAVVSLQWFVQLVRIVTEWAFKGLFVTVLISHVRGIQPPWVKHRRTVATGVHVGDSVNFLYVFLQLAMPDFFITVVTWHLSPAFSDWSCCPFAIFAQWVFPGSPFAGWLTNSKRAVITTFL